jgi:hypothetical protein
VAEAGVRILAAIAVETAAQLGADVAWFAAPADVAPWNII